MQGIEEDFDQCVGIVALEFIFTVFPAAIFSNVRTAFRVVKEEVGGTAEVLLAMCVIALAPVVDGRVTYGAKGCLVAVKHKFVVVEDALKVVQVLCEPFFVHEGAH